jgi:hypothetical protein
MPQRCDYRWREIARSDPPMDDGVRADANRLLSLRDMASDKDELRKRGCGTRVGPDVIGYRRVQPVVPNDHFIERSEWFQPG